MPIIEADLTDGLTVEVRNGRHVWHVDEPDDVPGGTDVGPSPYEHLLGALAGCTLITIRIVADKEGIPVDSVSASFEYEKIHAEDCHDCESDATGWLDHIITKIFIDGDFDEKQRARLERVAKRCPVHKTIENKVFFSETVVPG